MGEPDPTGWSEFQTKLAQERYARREKLEMILDRKLSVRESRDAKKQFYRTLAKAVPVRVARVNIDGLANTKDGLVVDVVSDLFKIETYSDLILKARSVHYKMKKLGCFSNVDVYLDTIDKNDPKGDLEITFKVREVGYWFTNLSMQATENEAHVVFEAGVPNVNGRGERLEASASQGCQGTRVQKFAYVTPMRNFYGNGDPKVSTLSAYVLRHGQEFPWVGLNGQSASLGVEALFTPRSWLKQTVRWQVDWRQLSAHSSYRTPFFAREICGHSLKSAVLHKLAVDTRDDMILPTKGFNVEASQELSGLGGDVLFLKNVVEGSIHHRISNSVTASLSGSVGMLTPVKGRKFSNVNSSSVFDSFTLGGPQCLRGFTPGGIVSSDNSLGGRAFWRICGQTYFSLPYLSKKTWVAENIKGHLFAEAGSVGNPVSKSMFRMVREGWVSDYRTTFGLGLVFRLSNFARAELNYCLPFIFKGSDRSATGLQFGIGLTYS